MIQANTVVDQRAELLARVFLTQRLNINVHPFGDADEALDFICTIRDKNLPGFLPFGVQVWGTDKELGTEADAATFGKQMMKGIRATTYFIPVIALLFSMQDDKGYFSWIFQPGEKGRTLARVTDLNFKACTKKQLDRIVNSITEWYCRLSHDILPDAGAIDWSQCPEDG
jgi:hypothetical protein